MELRGTELRSCQGGMCCCGAACKAWAAWSGRLEVVGMFRCKGVDVVKGAADHPVADLVFVLGASFVDLVSYMCWGMGSADMDLLCCMMGAC